MRTATLVSDDLRIRNAVMRQLEWDPEVDASEVGVTAREGAVTLTGFNDRTIIQQAAANAAAPPTTSTAVPPAPTTGAATG